MTRAVDMALEGNALFFDFTCTCKRKYLIAAAVGKYWSIPAVEAVKTACLLYYLQSGTHKEMIRIAQYYLSIYISTQLLHMNRFDRAHRAYGHKNRSLYLSVLGRYPPCSRLCLCIFVF